MQRDGASARVVIGDRGAGVDPEINARLFQPFVTSKKSGGTGLGLSISRDIVERHGGSIGLAPREGGGSCFALTLPAESGANAS